MLFATRNRRVYKVLKTVKEPNDEFIPLLPKRSDPCRGWMEATDTTDDNDGAVMSDQPKPKATPDFVLVQVETKRKVKKRRGKLRKLVSIIVRVVGYPFIPDPYLLQAPPECIYKDLQFASSPAQPTSSAASVLMFVF